MDNLKMIIRFGSTGGIYYRFVKINDGKPVSNALLFSALNAYLLAGEAAAGFIIIATLSEDVATDGIGVADDALSLIAAAKVEAEIVDIGLIEYGLAA
jgi:hypothetical protein